MNLSPEAQRVVDQAAELVRALVASGASPDEVERLVVDYLTAEHASRPGDVDEALPVVRMNTLAALGILREPARRLHPG